MSNFFEIDFLSVEAKKSGDAISLRYQINGDSTIHVVDGGYQETGEKIVGHIKKYYENPTFIDHVVVTHHDGDHTGGLRVVLKEFTVGALWMLRPWMYADDLIDRFSRFTSVDNLRKRLRDVYPNITALEEIAEENGIPIYEPFQGKTIGAFTVMAPTYDRYLDLIVESEKTPEAVKEAEKTRAMNLLKALGEKAISFLRAAWGQEVFSAEETSSENEMSIIQYANLWGRRILLTGDAGRGALAEAADFAPDVGLTLPGIDKFQVPHHGSRRNVSTEILDRWLGKRLPSKPATGSFTAIISSAKEDEDHPRKAVLRACIHRGATVVATEGEDIRTQYNAPERKDWVPVQPIEYPEEQEE